MTSAALSPSAPPTPTQPTGPHPSGATAVGRIRLFVGGLPADVTPEELQARFQPFGKVVGSEIVPQKEDAGTCRGFGYVDLEPVSEASLSKCFAVYNGTKWRGGRLRVEKARASFLDRLKAEWASQNEPQSEADKLGSEIDKGGAEIDKQGAEPTKAELLDPKGKPIFEPLRLKWGSWEFEKRTKVMPAAGGAKIKKSFRNVPEKSLWELEGMGGTGALSAAMPPATKAVTSTRAIETRPLGGNGVSQTGERSEDGKEKAHQPSAEDESPDAEERSEDSEGRSEDEGTEGSGREAEGAEPGDGVKGRVRELTAWEKLMQKAAAGQEDDDFIDEEVGGLEGFEALGKTPGNPGTARGTKDAGGLEGFGPQGKSPGQPGTASGTKEAGGLNDFGARGKAPGDSVTVRGTDGRKESRLVGGKLEKVELRGGKKDGFKQGANGSAPAESQAAKKTEVAALSDWERLMQKAAGALDEEESLDGPETGEFEQASGEGESDANEGSEGFDLYESKQGQEVAKGEAAGGGVNGARKAGVNEESTRAEELGAGVLGEGLNDVAAAGDDELEGGPLEERSEWREWGEEVDSEGDVMEEAEDVIDGADGVEGESEDDFGGEEVGDGAEETGGEDSGGAIDGEGLEDGNESDGDSFGSEEELSGSFTDVEKEVSEGEGREWQGEVSEEEGRNSGDGAGESDGRDSGGADAAFDDEGRALDSEEDGRMSKEESDDDGKEFDKARGGLDDDTGREKLLLKSALKLQRPVRVSDDADADFETAPAEDLEEEAATAGVPPESAGADGTAAERTADEEEIARQLAEERRKQLGILGAMFPDDARFFSEEAVQKAKRPSGFVPIARFDPSAAAKRSPENNEDASGANEGRTEAAPMESEERVRNGLTGSGRKTVTRATTAASNPEEIGKEARETGKEKSEKKRAVLKEEKRPRRGVSEGEAAVTEQKGGAAKEVGNRKSGLVQEGGLRAHSGAAKGSGNGARSGLQMVGEVLSRLSPQVLKYLDSDLLQRLTPGSKGTETEKKRRRGEGEKEGKRKRGEAEEGGKREGGEAKRKERGGMRSAGEAEERLEASGKKEKRGQRPEPREGGLEVGLSGATTGKGVPREESRRGPSKRKDREAAEEVYEDGHIRNEQKPGGDVRVGLKATGQNVTGRSDEAATGGSPEETAAGLSVEERKRLKREKRAQRRGSDVAGVADASTDRLDAGTDRSDGPAAVPVKQEVFVNPNWRALVGYVGGGKPTFSLASVLGGASDAGDPGPSDGPKSSGDGRSGALNMASGVNTSAVVQNVGSNAEFGADAAPGRSPLPDASNASGVGAGNPPAGAARHDDVSTGPDPAAPRSVAVSGPGDEDLGLSFVRSATAEQEWLASKSALAIDYKRKKRIAARVAPGGGKKRG
ncbi:protein with RRM/RBD/RNP motifs [Klebsormidium nitens]|uniref:Protein with RRM/RBD/RNP motifs n=1 Tax=Klebsormidium nitens TaxID=105231 RepID=A0A1Y1HXN5_KLENI|nr:protein with RRM/RBD/RNP motifs [Klebsormidium nitens]|eukprot:GAQ83424.1 protein with RRM/RBD/RNP motifs [Klebsormidium nitens]